MAYETTGANDFLGVDPDNLKNVGSTIDSEVSEESNSIYQKALKTLEEVTDPNNWSSQASTDLMNDLNSIKNELQTHLNELGEYGSTIQTIADGYAQVEEENAEAIHSDYHS